MKRVFLLLFLLGGSISGAQAQSCTASIASPATFTSVDPLTSGTYTTSTTLQVNCSGFNSSDTIAVCADLGSGSGGANGASERLLAGPGSGALRFQIYQDSGFAVPWGSVGSFGLANVPLLSRTGNGSLSATLYLKLDTSQGSTIPGAYSSSFSPIVKYGVVPGISGGCSGATLSNTTGAPFSVQTTLDKSCLLTVTQDVNFGTVQSLSAPVDATGGLSVQCTNSTAYKISLGLGNGAGVSSPAQRKMTGPSNAELTYGLYQDASRSQIWGNTLDVDTVGGSGSGAASPISVYGRIPAQAKPPAGTYSDMVVVTVTY